MAGVRTSGGLRPGTVQGAGGAIHFGEFNGYVDPGRAANQGTADRFFPAFTWEPDDLLPFQYTPKVRGPERNMGGVENTHVSVKPISMIQWLWRLAAAPGEYVIDPFAGSGSHVVAAIREGLHIFGVEREAEYVKIARGRAAHALANL
jgi:DNA modification methylase